MSIKAGDLVMVVRWPHEHMQDQLGRIFTVDAIASLVSCPMCHAIFCEPVAAVSGLTRGVPMAWLRRIPPLNELDDVKQDEEITA